MPDAPIESYAGVYQRVGHKVVRLNSSGYQRPRERALYCLNGAGGADDWAISENSIGNIERALIERVLTVKDEAGNRVSPPQPAPDYVRSELAEFQRRLIHTVGKVEQLTTRDFVDSYVGRRKAGYENALKTLPGNPIQPGDAVINMFCKAEKDNLTLKGDPCPRIISPASRRFNIAIGVHLKPLEKPVFHGIGRLFGGVTVMKGYNATERGKFISDAWFKYNKPVAVLLDAARFDQHVNLQVINWEHDTWEKLAMNRAELRHLNKMRKTNTLIYRSSEGGFKVRLRGVRMSGAMDTALGNCTTMCAMTWSFMRQITAQYSYFNDGDDGVLIIEEEHLDSVLAQFKPYFLKLGFTMKLEGVARELEHIEFCQSHPVYTGTGWRMVRDPFVCLGKDSLAVAGPRMSGREQSDRSNAIGWCGLSLAGDVPIFCEFYKSLITGAPPARGIELTTGMEYLAKGMHPNQTAPSDECRLSFQKAFRLSPEHQLAIEADIASYARVASAGRFLDEPATLVMQLSKSYLHHIYTDRL